MAWFGLKKYILFSEDYNKSWLYRNQWVDHETEIPLIERPKFDNPKRSTKIHTQTQTNIERNQWQIFVPPPECDIYTRAICAYYTGDGCIHKLAECQLKEALLHIQFASDVLCVSRWRIIVNCHRGVLIFRPPPTPSFFADWLSGLLYPVWCIHDFFNRLEFLILFQFWSCHFGWICILKSFIMIDLDITVIHCGLLL